MGYAELGVRGEVYLWGTVVEHKWGWRAQFAYPKTLVVVPEILLFGWREYLKILIGYGADLFVAGEMGNIPLWTKQCRGFEHVREVAARLAQSRHSERWERFAAAEAHAKEVYDSHLRLIRQASQLPRPLPSELVALIVA
jgi:hypothetical protein